MSQSYVSLFIELMMVNNVLQISMQYLFGFGIDGMVQKHLSMMCHQRGPPGRSGYLSSSFLQQLKTTLLQVYKCIKACIDLIATLSFFSFRKISLGNDEAEWNIQFSSSVVKFDHIIAYFVLPK